MGRWGLGLVVVLMGAGPGRGRTLEAQTVIYANAVVWTGDPRLPWTQAIWVEGSRLRGVGGTEALRRRAGETVPVVDLEGAFVCPGLVDGHAHVMGFGLGLRRIDLTGTRSLEETLERVAAGTRRAAAQEKSVWVRGRGWDQNDWPNTSFPSRHDLDRVSAGLPVVLTRVDGHALWVNSRALAASGVDAGTADPPGGRILRDGDGEPTGILVDAAMDLVLNHVPAPGREEKIEAIRRAASAMVEAGLTGAHDMGMPVEDETLYRDLARAGDLVVRIYAALSADRSLFTETAPSPLHDPLAARLAQGPDREWEGGTFKLGMVKFYVDGALGSRGAALLAPYADDPGNRGLLIIEADSLSRGLDRVARAGFQSAVHAIGDRANRTVLDAWSALPGGPPMGLRPVPPFPLAGVGERPAVLPALRLEHAQIVDPADWGRLGELGILASMQPTHCTSDMPWAPERLGPDHLAGAYAWRALITRGALFVAGSDFPVESHRPVLGLYAAVTRRPPGAGAGQGWSPEQRLTREEALVAFTAAPAYASGDLHRLGTLTEGKEADLVVFDRNLVTCDPEDLPGARALLTVIGGRVCWCAEDAPFAARLREVKP